MSRTPRQLEHIVKGFANHRRLQIMSLLKTEPELSLSGISRRLKIDTRTASVHVIRLTTAGLVLKRSEGRGVRHRLTRRAEEILTFLRILGSV